MLQHAAARHHAGRWRWEALLRKTYLKRAFAADALDTAPLEAAYMAHERQVLAALLHKQQQAGGSNVLAQGEAAGCGLWEACGCVRCSTPVTPCQLRCCKHRRGSPGQAATAARPAVPH
jgi:hypothetical protein